MAEKKTGASSNTGTVIAVAGAGAALIAAYVLLKKGSEIKGSLTFTHKGLGINAWAGIGIAIGDGPMVWESHKEVQTVNGLTDISYEVDFKESLPKEVEAGTYDVWAFLHNPVGPVNMDIYAQVKDYLPTGFQYYYLPLTSWLYTMFADIGTLTPGYIAARRYKDALKYEGGLI